MCVGTRMFINQLCIQCRKEKMFVKFMNKLMLWSAVNKNSQYMRV
jgi:hypothetical protein